MTGRRATRIRGKTETFFRKRRHNETEMQVPGSIQLMAALFLAGMPVAADGQGLPHPSTEVPKIVFDSHTVKTSEFTIRPPDTSRTHCMNRIASWGHPVTVGELAGQGQHPVRDIRITHYSRGNAPASEAKIREMLTHVWQGSFESAECFQMWDEGNFWSCSASIEYFIGTPGELITDGWHVYLKDRDGKTWFLRLLPAGQ